jgi:site-specific DNA recombinase
MVSRYQELVPRNGHTLVVCAVARISGCQNQKEMSLEDQVDHAKEEVAELYEGPDEYRIIATAGKGEALDRPELAEIEHMIRTDKLDLLVMEDVGRLVRGVEAVRIWGIAVDYGTRCIAPNDCLDTDDESWEADLIAACRDHVGHNAHTSKRLKKKLMNRFKKFGGSTALPIKGCIKPEGAKTYDDWKRDDGATETIKEGLGKLKVTLNCSAVADWFNEIGFSTGPYCRNDEWDGAMVRRFYQNPLLAGVAQRGKRHTVKNNETGRRVSKKNTVSAPNYYECPHLSHVDAIELEEVNAALDEQNRNCGRPAQNGADPLLGRPRKRTHFPGDCACCWYCGWHDVWGGNGVTKNLMCSASRKWQCWHSIGFDGQLATERIASHVTSAMYQLDGFDKQYAELVESSVRSSSGGSSERLKQLARDEAAVARERKNLVDAILKYGERPMLQETLDSFDDREKKLQRERYAFELLKSRELVVPSSTTELRSLLEENFAQLAVESFEFGDFMRLLVPEFHVYSVRLCDGGHLLPRARVKIDLAGSVVDAEHVAGLKGLLTRVITVDLFDRPPQRERISEEAVRLAANGMKSREIARNIGESPKPAAVDNALALQRTMDELGLTDPLVLVMDPPQDYPKLRRHKNSKYRFKPRPGYERPSL